MSAEKEVYRSRIILAHPNPLFKEVTSQVQIGVRNVTKTRGIIKRESYQEDEPVYETRTELVQTGGVSDKDVDLDRLAMDLATVCNELDKDGYNIVEVISSISGRYQYEFAEAGKIRVGTNPILGVQGSGGGGGYGYGYGYGYSLTSGIIVLARLKAES